MSKYPIPPWLDQAYRYRGLREIPGKQHNPTIQRWLKTLKAAWSDDETPWCDGVDVAVFEGGCEAAGGLEGVGCRYHVPARDGYYHAFADARGFGGWGFGGTIWVFFFGDIKYEA